MKPTENREYLIAIKLDSGTIIWKTAHWRDEHDDGWFTYKAGFRSDSLQFMPYENVIFWRELGLEQK